MKKILTFLVMLCCSVSILMAQVEVVSDNTPAPKFPYQAVVRDMTAKNLSATNR